MTTLVELTVENCAANPDNAALADLVMDLAGIADMSCRHIELSDGMWLFEMFGRNLRDSVAFDIYGPFTYTQAWAA